MAEVAGTAAGHVTVEVRASLDRYERDLRNSERLANTFGRRAERAFDVAGKGVQRLSRSVLNLRSLLLSLGAAATLGKIVSTAAEFQRLETRLRSVTNSQEAASSAFRALVQFAVDTPNSLKQVVEAFIRLSSIGIKPTIEDMTNFADLASAMGRSIDDTAAAVVGAIVGETERLKQFGIVARSEGQKISFTFDGVTTTIDRTADGVVKFLSTLSKEKFGGAAQREMRTLLGAFSNLGDAIDVASAAIGDAGLSDEIIKTARALTSLVEQNPEAVREIGQNLAQAVAVARDAFGFLVDNIQEVISGIAALAALKITPGHPLLKLGAAAVAYMAASDALKTDLQRLQDELKRVDTEIAFLRDNKPEFLADIKATAPEAQNRLKELREELATMDEAMRSLSEDIMASGPGQAALLQARLDQIAEDRKAVVADIAALADAGASAESEASANAAIAQQEAINQKLAERAKILGKIQDLEAQGQGAPAAQVAELPSPVGVDEGAMRERLQRAQVLMGDLTKQAETLHSPFIRIQRLLPQVGEAVFGMDEDWRQLKKTFDEIIGQNIDKALDDQAAAVDLAARSAELEAAGLGHLVPLLKLEAQLRQELGVGLSEEQHLRMRNNLERQHEAEVRADLQGEIDSIEDENALLRAQLTLTADLAELERIRLEYRRQGYELTEGDQARLLGLIRENDALTAQKEAWDGIADSIDRAVEDGMANFIEALATGENAFESLGRTALSVLGDILIQLAKLKIASEFGGEGGGGMSIGSVIAGALFKGIIGGALGAGTATAIPVGGGAGAGNLAGGSYFIPGGGTPIVMHKGRGPGEAGTSRSTIPTSALPYLPRLHDGMLKPGELPAVIRDEESVLTPRQLAAVAGMGGGEPPMTNITINNLAPGVEVEAKPSAEGTEITIRRMRDDRVHDFATGGPGARALERRYGLTPKAG